jgi:nucleotide-binding universal stress UspA family protein
MHSDVGSISTAITSLAREKKVGWIAMEGQSGPIAAALLGSITRQVIRTAPCPVWVIHQPKEKDGIEIETRYRPAA